MKKYRDYLSPTMTVKELIEYLSAFPPEMPVASSWEGQLIPITKMETVGYYHNEVHTDEVLEPTLVLDCDN